MMAYLLLYSFFFGMAVGVFYDANRVIRVFCGVRYSKRIARRMSRMRLPFCKKEVGIKEKTGVGWGGRCVIFLGDVLTFLFGALGIIILNYSYNYGSFRVFTAIGAIVGFVLYLNTLGRLALLVLEPFALCVKYAILSLFVIFGYPFFKIGKFIAKTYNKIVFLYRFTLEKHREKLYNVREEVYLFEMSENGFLKSDENAKKER